MSYLPKNPSLIQRSQSTNILDAIEKRFHAEIIGYEDVLKLVLKIVRAKLQYPEFKAVQLLLDGAPATGKTWIIQTIMAAIGAGQCVWYDATMATSVGLLDHLYSLDNTKIRYICLDEIDKMKKQYQFGILSAIESGIMKETKYGRQRSVDTSHMTFFATSNNIKNVIEPLRTRFLVYDFPDYTAQQFHDVAFKQLTGKYDIKAEYAERIIQAINAQIPKRTMRTVRDFATLIQKDNEIDELIQIFKRRKEFN